MIIKGNTVGTTMPRTDWNQTDPQKADYLKGREDLTATIKKAQSTAVQALSTANSHINDNENPHCVTAEQVGLGNVDNTADKDKPVSTKQAAAIAETAKWHTAANVKRFGATGDGVTDDTEAIQSAFDSGLTVVFPAGKYKFKGITCNHAVDVVFENAEIVPIFHEGTNGVLNKLFTFTDCEKVTVKGLRIILEPTTNERKHKHLTESIAEFHNCENVQLVDWTVKNLMYWNRGNTPSELYNRRGILFTAIDSKIEVVNCEFAGMAYEEWNWVTYTPDNVKKSAAHFRNCYFHDANSTYVNKDGDTVNCGLSCIGIFAHTAEVVDCTFENIACYDISMVNVMSLYGDFSNNIIINCKVGGVCDFRENSWVFTTYAKIDNNRMVNSRCDKFAAISGQYVQITNNVATARTFCCSSGPLSGNILREEDEITKIRYVIENNVVEALDTELIHAEIVDIGINAEKALVYIDFNEKVEEGEEPAWKSSDSEIMCRNNRFFSDSTGKSNANLVVVDVGRLIMHDNTLYLGKRTAAESTYTAIQLSYANVDGIEVDLVGNRVEKNTVSETAKNPHVVYISSKYQNVKMNAFYNSVRNGDLLLASGYSDGVLNVDRDYNLHIN